MLLSSQMAPNSTLKDNDTLAMDMLSIRMASRLLQDMGQLTHFRTSLMPKQLEPGKASNAPSACLHTSDSAAYGSALTAPQSSGACAVMPQAHQSRPFTTAKMRCKPMMSGFSGPLGTQRLRGMRLQTN